MTMLHFGWFQISWWKYLLESPKSWTKFWCRAKGHPGGGWWWNPGGLEPNMRCKNCDDFLG